MVEIYRADNTLFAHLFSRKRYVIVIGRDRSAAQHGDCVRVSIYLPRGLSVAAQQPDQQQWRAVEIYDQSLSGIRWLRNGKSRKSLRVFKSDHQLK